MSDCESEVAASRLTLPDVGTTHFQSRRSPSSPIPLPFPPLTNLTSVRHHPSIAIATRAFIIDSPTTGDPPRLAHLEDSTRDRLTDCVWCGDIHPSTYAVVTSVVLLLGFHIITLLLISKPSTGPPGHSLPLTCPRSPGLLFCRQSPVAPVVSFPAESRLPQRPAAAHLPPPGTQPATKPSIPPGERMTHAHDGRNTEAAATTTTRALA